MNKRYQVIYDTENFTDSTGFFYSLEEALNIAKDALISWMTEEQSNWKIGNGILKPTKKQIENWNYMIDTCEAYVVDLEYDGNNLEEKETESYYYVDGHYYPSLKITGWKYWKS